MSILFFDINIAVYFFDNNNNNDNISRSHTLNALVPYGYIVILSNVCNLLSSLLLSAILLTSINFCVHIMMITSNSLLRFYYSFTIE